MPHTHASNTTPLYADVPDLALAIGDFSIDAFHFVQDGVQFAADRIHGPAKGVPSVGSRHITGQQLCEGLRELALERWGMMAGVILARWGVTSTHDFGRIVFAFIEAGLFQKQPTDTLNDFANVYDFARTFSGHGYHVKLPDRIA